VLLQVFEVMASIIDRPLNVLVPQNLLRCYFEDDCTWGAEAAITLQQFEDLQTFANLRATSKLCKGLLSGTVIHTTLRLANIDLENVEGLGWIGNDLRGYFATCFRANLKLVCSNMKLVMWISPQLVATDLYTLSRVELQTL
jgi:hypothetical protein